MNGMVHYSIGASVKLKGKEGKWTLYDFSTYWTPDKQLHRTAVIFKEDGEMRAVHLEDLEIVDE